MAILTAEFWGKILDRLTRVMEKQGLATVLVLGGSYYGFTEVVIPVRDGHLRFMDRVATSTETTALSMQRIEIKVDRACRALEHTLGQIPD